MKHLLFLLTMLISFAALSEEDCDPPGNKIMPIETTSQLSKIHDALRGEFKRRPLPKNYSLALSVETNFSAPFVGRENYWGRIYLREGDDDHVIYRDEQIGERHYKEEKKDPEHVAFLATYSIKEINSPGGLSLIKAAGAEVNVKSIGENFSAKTGGRLSIRVKAPGDKQSNLVVDILRSGGRVTKFLIQGNKRIPFESFRINASRNFLGVTSILNGVDDIQFISSGQTVAVVKQ